MDESTGNQVYLDRGDLGRCLGGIIAWMNEVSSHETLSPQTEVYQVFEREASALLAGSGSTVPDEVIRGVTWNGEGDLRGRYVEMRGYQDGPFENPEPSIHCRVWDTEECRIINAYATENDHRGHKELKLESGEIITH